MLRVSAALGPRDPRNLDPFPIEPGNGNRRRDHSVLAQCDQPGNLRSKRIFRLISRALDAQSPLPAAGRFDFVSLIFGMADQPDGRVPRQIVEAKRLLEPGFPVKLVGFSEPHADFP